MARERALSRDRRGGGGRRDRAWSRACRSGLVGEAEAARGGVDILVNNAGLTRDALALRMTDAVFQTVLEVNLTAAFRLTRLVLRGMLRRRHGRIIGVTSVVALTGNPGQ